MKKIKLFVKMSWDVSIRYYILLLVSCAISGVQVFLNLSLPALFIEALATGSSMGKCGKYAAIIVLSNVILFMCNQVIEGKLEVEKIYVNDMLNKKLSQKIMTLGYDKIENPYYLDLRQQAVYAIEVQDAITVFVYTMTDTVKKSFIILELFVVMYQLSRFLVLTILVLDIIVVIAYILFKRYEKKFMDKLAVLNRKFSYYIGLCFDETIQKDIRLYNMSEMLTDKVKDENKNILDYQMGYRCRKGLFNGVISVLSVVQSVISYTYIIMRTFRVGSGARLSYGQFTFYINAAINAFNTAKELLFDLVNISQTLEYLNPYIEFMKLEEDDKHYGEIEMDSRISSLEFRNVTFIYPGAEKEVLSNVSFKVSSNQKISIVGLNGAGKSTIVKLICRLYQPTKGSILINDIDIWEYNEESYDKNITTVFQDYKIFAMSIFENIVCGKSGIYKDVLQWMDKLNISYLDKKYEKGIYTELNKAYEDEGIDLSGGEKQKLAITRALYKGGSIFILDEPTSALDPKSEAEIYSQFEKYTNGKMTVYISHRMSSATLCDKVLVLKEGKVIDFDNHKELIKNKDSLYYKMFMAQAENYAE